MTRTYYCLHNLFLFIFLACVPLEQTTSSKSGNSSQIVTRGLNFDQEIKTVRLYPYTGDRNDVLLPPVIPISQEDPLILEFDELYGEFKTYNARIIHCNANWEQSILNDLDFLFQYNEYPITNYEFSYNTRTPYIHYRLQVPKVKRPGNYVLQVYEGSDKNATILSRRFVVYASQALVAAEVGVSDLVSERRTNQRIRFTVNYGNLEILNPLEQVKVVVRKNYRWDNAIINLQPTFIGEDQRLLEYDPVTLANEFLAGNEYRNFDIRTVDFLGTNVGKIAVSEDSITAYLLRDVPRDGAPYSEYADLNGDFIIENVDQAGSSGDTEADYVQVHFFLKTDAPAPSPVYLAGRATNYLFTPETQMNYNASLGAYTKKMLLKQGWYDYLYLVPGTENPYVFEGNYFETGNTYDIIVYFRGPGMLADTIIGYTRVFFNNRVHPRFR